MVAERNHWRPRQVVIAYQMHLKRLFVGVRSCICNKLWLPAPISIRWASWVFVMPLISSAMLLLRLWRPPKKWRRRIMFKRAFTSASKQDIEQKSLPSQLRNYRLAVNWHQTTFDTPNKKASAKSSQEISQLWGISMSLSGLILCTNHGMKLLYGASKHSIFVVFSQFCLVV